jgi:mono/diheme cytochrome c family protein
VDGRQYVAITAGGRTGPTTSFGPLTGATIPDGTGTVWVFAAPSEIDIQSSRRTTPAPVLRSTSGVPASSGILARGDRPTGAPSAQPALAGQSMLNGMFTSVQAARGEQRFKESCATCHSIEEQAASLQAKWRNGSLHDLFRAISTTMPQNSPGSLTPDDYASIVALYLRQSGHAPGSTELPSDPATLAKLRIDSN